MAPLSATTTDRGTVGGGTKSGRRGLECWSAMPITMATVALSADSTAAMSTALTAATSAAATLAASSAATASA